MKKINLYIWDTDSVDYLFPLTEELLGNTQLKEHYSLVDDVINADFIVLSMAVEWYLKKFGLGKVEELKKFASNNNKNILLFTGGDCGKTIKGDNVYSIRLGGFKSKFNERNFIMSPFFEDPILKFNFKNKYLNKSSNPTVGFVGHSNGSFVKLIKEFVIFVKSNGNRVLQKDYSDYQNFYPSSYYRHKYLMKIKSNDDIESQFIFRSKYRAGAKNETEKIKTTTDFFENISNSMFTFCMRGGGNFSVRFYETLALGRIPILIDTDCKLPFEDLIDWNKHSVIVRKNQINEINNVILAFYNSKSPEELIEIQKSNRVLWEEYFTKTSFFIKFYNVLVNRK